MLFKKKEEIPEVEETPEESKPLTPIQISFLKRLRTIGDKAERYESYRTQKIITDAEYHNEMKLLIKELDDVAEAIKNDDFDELMGRPMLLFPEIFKDYNKEVHDAIEEVCKDTNGETDPTR